MSELGFKSISLSIQNDKESKDQEELGQRGLHNLGLGAIKAHQWAPYQMPIKAGISGFIQNFFYWQAASEVIPGSTPE